jgi:preprotein translocase SecE subunit
MAAEAVAEGRVQALVTFIRDSFHEVRYKTTWPDFAQVRQASVAIVVFVGIVGLFITIFDLLLNLILVRGLPALFR